MAGYAVSAIDDMPDVATFTDPGDPAWKPIQHYLGLSAFGINAFIAKADGDTIAPPHDEADFGQEEVYLAVRACPAHVGGDQLDAPAGTAVAIRDPALTRRLSRRGRNDRARRRLRTRLFPDQSWRPVHFEGLARHPAIEE